MLPQAYKISNYERLLNITQVIEQQKAAIEG